MNRSKQLTDEQIIEVIKQYEDDAKSGLVDDALHGYFSKLVRTFHDPYSQPKYRLTKSYKKIDANNIEFETRNNKTIKIEFIKMFAKDNKRKQYFAKIDDDLLATENQKQMIELLNEYVI